MKLDVRYRVFDHEPAEKPGFHAEHGEARDIGYRDRSGR
jgi:hypothetical protein